MASGDRPFSLSTLFATASLAISCVTLYFSNLAPPSLAMIAGPNIKVYYPADGGFGLYLPVAFVNSSAATGTVYRVGVSLTARKPGADTFYFEWRNFTRWADQPGLDEPAHALAVQGNSALAKIVWLTWRAESEPKLVIQPGDYTLAVHVWAKPSGPPETQLHELTVDAAAYTTLEHERTNKQDFLVDMTLDRQLPPNRLLTSYEATSLLGLPKN
jgi:hypothetical protein